MAQHRGQQAAAVTAFSASRKLRVAVEAGNIDAVRTLLRRVDTVETDKFGNTLVYIACHYGHTDTLEHLLEKGGDANKAHNNGTTPVMLAAQGGRLDILTLLLEHGGDANKAKSNGVTPMYVAAENGHAQVIMLLLEKGGDPNAGRTHFHWDGTCCSSTPLHIAARNGHAHAVHVLLKANANTFSLWNNLRPLHTAVVAGHRDVVQTMTEVWPLDPRPWKVFVKGIKGKTAVYNCADLIREIHKYLYKPQYVDPWQPDGKGRTPERLASDARYGGRRHDISKVLRAVIRRRRGEAYTAWLRDIGWLTGRRPGDTTERDIAAPLSVP